MTFDLRTLLIGSSLALIILIGSLTIYSVTSIDIYYFLRFLIISIFAIFLVTIVFNQINLNRIISVGWILFSINLLIVLIVEIVGSEIKGSKRWIDFGFLSLQPSEFMKITFALFAIQYLRFYNYNFTILRSILLLFILLYFRWKYIQEKKPDIINLEEDINLSQKLNYTVKKLFYLLSYAQ